MAYYQDVMDNDRVVNTLGQPVGKYYRCAVYWLTRNGMTYGGETNIAVSLFEDTPLNRRIGFAPYNVKA